MKSGLDGYIQCAKSAPQCGAHDCLMIMGRYAAAAGIHPTDRATDHCGQTSRKGKGDGMGSSGSDGDGDDRDGQGVNHTSLLVGKETRRSERVS